MARLEPGQPCQVGTSDMCTVGSFCDGTKCAMTQRIGGPCSTGVDCYSDRCAGGVCVVPEDYAD
jgi:hypothetical protein